MYVSPNFKTKKALKDAVDAGKPVTVFQHGPFDTGAPVNGVHSAEGPHYPEPHKWYATIVVENSVVVRVK